MAHYIGVVQENGHVATFCKLDRDGMPKSEGGHNQYPCFSEDEGNPGIKFDSLDQALRMCFYLTQWSGFEYDLIVFEDDPNDNAENEAV